MNRKTNYNDFPRTDAGNAELFARIYEERLRFDHQRKRWLNWNKHWWEPDGDGLVNRLAKECSRARHLAALNITDNQELREAEAKWALQSEAAHRLASTIKLARSEHPLAETGGNWDLDSMLLGVANGVVNLSTGKLRDGMPEDRITMHSRIAVDPKADCPRWIRFLEEIFGGDTELISFVQRATGYSLTGATREQCLFCCYGVGANGKSTFLESVRHISGNYAYTLPFSAFELSGRSSIPNDVAALVGKRFVTAVETNESVRLNEARIKALTGEDNLSARFLYGEYFNFYTSSKFWLAFNHKPIVNDDSNAFWRRIRLIPFLAQFPKGKADDKLSEKLRAEGPGILNWAIHGCLEWRRDGLGMPSSVANATRVYREESDPIEKFLGDCCLTEPATWTSSKTLYKKYCDWTDDDGTFAQMNQKYFSQRLQTRGFKREQRGKNRTRGWVGIGLYPKGGVNT